MKSLSTLNIPEIEKKAIRSFSRRVKKALGTQLVDIKLYGSKAREKYGKESDIDIFVLVKKKSYAKRSKVAQASADVYNRYHISLSSVLFDVFEEKINKQLRSPYFESIDKEGIKI